MVRWRNARRPSRKLFKSVISLQRRLMNDKMNQFNSLIIHCDIEWAHDHSIQCKCMRLIQGTRGITCGKQRKLFSFVFKPLFALDCIFHIFPCARHNWMHFITSAACLTDSKMIRPSICNELIARVVGTQASIPNASVAMPYYRVFMNDISINFIMTFDMPCFGCHVSLPSVLVDWIFKPLCKFNLYCSTFHSGS